MKEAQEKVAGLIRIYKLETAPQTRFLDLASDLGELSKEILKASEYGEKSCGCYG